MSKRLNGRLRRISRRELLKSLAVASLVPWVVACSSSSDDDEVLDDVLFGSLEHDAAACAQTMTETKLSKT